MLQDRMQMPLDFSGVFFFQIYGTVRQQSVQIGRFYSQINQKCLRVDAAIPLSAWKQSAFPYQNISSVGSKKAPSLSC